MKYEIRHRLSRKILFSLKSDGELTKEQVIQAAIKADVDLSCSNLRGSDLSHSDLKNIDLRSSDLSYSNLCGSNLRGSDLSHSNLSHSDLKNIDLRGSNLSYSNLCGSNLRGSKLSYSNLCGSNLYGSDLSYSDLSHSDLRCSDLRGVDLSGSNLRGSNLLPIRDDFWAVLSSAPQEVTGLRTALLNGKVLGSVYTGDCACLVGTIANVRGCDYRDLGTLSPDSNRPAERFFLGIREGDTPKNNQFSKLAVGWIDEWLMNTREAFVRQKRK